MSGASSDPIDLTSDDVKTADKDNCKHGYPLYPADQLDCCELCGDGSAQQPPGQGGGEDGLLSSFLDSKEKLTRKETERAQLLALIEKEKVL